ncbi:hypothetical protein C0Q70_14167 [Pomacea canaliculata]|uniref:MARVEL domain-containing protein n=1 Tax=Pomacea canaliculata TaxID=400727 RepID=A0A2T7NZA4_POMCA|nr:hypothetical protein C0Q70_14167 [Pomacea canaliculata]
MCDIILTKFNKNCVLYSDVVYEHYNETNDNNVYFRIRFGASSVCNYNLAVTAIFSIIYSSAMIAGYIFIYFRDKGDKKIDLAHIAFLIHCLTEMAVALLMLVLACMVSAGFTHLCKGITSGPYSVPSCSHAEKFKDWRGHDATNFYTCLAVATAGAWFQFVFWLLQGLFGVWKLWRLNMLPVLPDWLKLPCVTSA